MDELMKRALLDEALTMTKHSYTPYSHFKVGAALLGKSGKIYGGCNIENAAYTPSNCAERTAVFTAVAAGEREFEAICVVGGPEGDCTDFCPPCGVCRQVLREFCDPARFTVLLGREDGEIKSFLLNELLPESFGGENLGD